MYPNRSSLQGSNTKLAFDQQIITAKIQSTAHETSIVIFSIK